jgi:hypothetical protein
MNISRMIFKSVLIVLAKENLKTISKNRNNCRVTLNYVNPFG